MSGYVVRKGDLFEHPFMLDPDWRPAAGQKWTDGPHAVCEVTKVQRDTAWYRYRSRPGRAMRAARVADVAVWVETYHRSHVQ